MNNQRVSDWERGVHQPSERYLKMLATALDVSVAYFYGATEQPETPPLLEVFNGGEDKLDEALSILKQLVERQEALEAAVTAMAELLAERLPQARQGQRRAS